MSAAEQIEPGIGTNLTEFEGAAVVGIGYEVRGIAGGLNEPAKFNPVIFGRGEEGCLVLRFVHRAPRFDPADKEDPSGDAIRVQILDVIEGTIVDEEVVAEALKRQREINEEGRRQEEAKKGIHQLPMGGPDDEKEFRLATEHAAGDHAEPIDGCPICSVAVSEPAESDDEQAVLVRQHLAGVHSDGLRDQCVMCKTESAAEAEEQAEPRKRRGR